MLVSHTQLACFRRCQREFFFRYRLGRYPVGTSAALATGRAVHAAIGKFLRGEDWMTDPSPGGPVPSLVSVDPVQRAMMLGYIARWSDAGYTIERTDVPFVYAVGNVEGHDIEVNGEIDAVGYETARPDEKAIFEHKTTSEDITPGSAYWRRVLMVDAQVSTYLRAGATMGYKKVIYDVLRKPQLRQKAKESGEDFCARIVEDIASRPEYYYQRAVVVRLENEREDFVKDVLGTVRLMMVGEYPRNVDSCFKWNRPCDFFSVCSGEVGIDDDARFQTRERKPQPATATPQPAAKAPSGGSVGKPDHGEGESSSSAPRTLRGAESGKKYVFGGDAPPDRS